jgi:tRNA pseudouridine38-40 synthase
VSTPPDRGGRDTADHDDRREGSVRWRLRVAYDGSGFHGFAAQEGLTTVAGELAAALSRVARTPVTLTCAGRTDAGVHALDQVVHFDVPADRSTALEPAALIRSCNSQVGPSIVVRSAEPAPAGFDARHSAVSRRYRYLVVNAPVADPLLAGLTWHVADPLDLRAMAAASDALLGEHDFRAFCRRVPGTPTEAPIPRRVLDARWTRIDGRPSGARTAGTSDLDGRRAPGGPELAPVVGDLLAFEIEANAFCHQMVRSLVGTLVDVGRGRRRPSDMLHILRSADRAGAGQPAPPQGLTLMMVRY